MFRCTEETDGVALDAMKFVAADGQLALTDGKGSKMNLTESTHDGRGSRPVWHHKEVGMLPKETMHKPAGQVAQSIERQIVQRTWGRIHRLAVEVIDDRVIVHGCTSSYHSKQLALEGALDVLGSTRSTQIELDIQVSASVLSPMNRRASRVEATSV
jgi:hypothetical protein